MIDAAMWWCVVVAGVILLVERGEVGDPPALADPRVVLWALIAVVAWVGYDAYGVARWGGTAGRRILDIEVRTADGALADRRQAALRAVSRLGGVVLLGAGAIPVWFDPQRRALHDRLAGTVVVRGSVLEPAGEGPGGVVGGGPPADATEAAIRAVGPPAASAAWLRTVATQTTARLEVVAPSWRRSDGAAATRDRAFCVLLAALLRRYPDQRELLVAVIEEHAVLGDVPTGRECHLQALLDDADRARRWVGLPPGARIDLLLDAGDGASTHQVPDRERT